MTIEKLEWLGNNEYNCLYHLWKKQCEMIDWINCREKYYGKQRCENHCQNTHTEGSPKCEMQESGSNSNCLGKKEPRPDIELKYNELADECGTCDTCLKINERITRNKTLDEIEERLLSDETEGMSIKSIIAEMRGKK